MISRTKRELRAVEDKMAEVAEQAKSIIESASKEGRSRTDEENADIADCTKKLEVLKGNKRDLEDALATEQEIQDVVGNMGKNESGIEVKSLESIEFTKRHYTPGEVFVESEQFKSMVSQVKQGGHVSTGPIDLSTKGTLGITAGSGGTALAGPVPEVIPGVVDKLFQQVRVPQLILSGQTSSSSLRYVVEGTATSGAAGVAEAGAKPQSTLGFTTSDEPVRKIATSIKVTDEMLEDASQVRSYIDGRLRLFVEIEEERQVVLGAGTNELIGIKPSGNTRGINIYAGGTAAGNKAVQLFKALNGQRGSALLEPDWIVMNPSDYQDLRLLTDTAGQFFGGGPFQGQYGNGGLESVLSGQVSGATDQIWGLPIYVTTATGAGTALIGTRSAAQLFHRGGLTVEATNSHDTDFLYNLVTIRAEKRGALAVYRPTAFTEVRLS